MKVVISEEVAVGRPAEDVFRFIGVDHCRNHPRWDPHVFRIEPPDGAMGRGARITIVRRTLGRLEALPFEVTAWEPPSIMAISTSSPDFDLTLASRCEPIDGQSTRLVLTGEARVSGLRVLLLPLMRATFGAQIRANLRRIQAMIESTGAPEGAGATAMPASAVR